MTTNGNALVVAEGRAVDASIMERVIAAGDLSKLTPTDRVSYYVSVCRSLGLNPLTKPFDYLSLNGKLVLYSTKNCTDQLRQIHHVSVDGLKRENIDNVHVVTANVSTPDGRRDEDVGAVNIKGLTGEALANALMKATTKAKRRATLSICGLSFPDESEIESIPGAQRITVTADGEVLDPRGDRPEPRPAALPAAQSEAGLFEMLCGLVDTAETKAALNQVAAKTIKANEENRLTKEDRAHIAAAVKKKGALLAERPSEPAAEKEAS